MDVLAQVSKPEVALMVADGGVVFCVTEMFAEAVQPLAAVPVTPYTLGALMARVALVCQPSQR